MNLIWLIPDSLVPLAVVALAFAVMLRLVSFGSALLIIIALALAPVLIDPLIDLGFAILPWWALLLAGVAIVLIMFRLLVSIVLGGRAADHVVGHVTAVGFIGLFRLLLLPFRFGGALLFRLLTLR